MVSPVGLFCACQCARGALHMQELAFFCAPVCHCSKVSRVHMRVLLWHSCLGSFSRMSPVTSAHTPSTSGHLSPPP